MIWFRASTNVQFGPRYWCRGRFFYGWCPKLVWALPHDICVDDSSQFVKITLKRRIFWVAVSIWFILLRPHFYVYCSKELCSLSFPLSGQSVSLNFLHVHGGFIFSFWYCNFSFKSSLAILLFSRGLLTKLNCKYGCLMLQAGHVIILNKMRLHDLNYVPNALLEHSKWAIKCLSLLLTSMRAHLFFLSFFFQKFTPNFTDVQCGLSKLNCLFGCLDIAGGRHLQDSYLFSKWRLWEKTLVSFLISTLNFILRKTLSCILSTLDIKLLNFWEI